MATNEAARLPASHPVEAQQPTFDAFIGELRSYAPALSARLTQFVSVLGDAEAEGIATTALDGWMDADLFAVFAPEEVDSNVRSVRSAGGARWLSYVEMARNLAVLLPIAVTWLGLSVAAELYGFCTANADSPDALARSPFLQLWQAGFHGVSGVTCTGASVPILGQFSSLLLLDFGLILFIIATTAVSHYWSNVVSTTRDRSARRLVEQLRYWLAEFQARRDRLRVPTDTSGLVAQTVQQMRILQAAFTRTSAEMLAAVREQADSTTAAAATLSERQSALAERLASAAEGIVESSGEFGKAAGQLVATIGALESRLGASADALIREATSTREQVVSIASRLEASGGEAVIRELSGITERIETVHRDLSNVDTSLGYQGAISGRLDRVLTAITATTDELSSAARRFKELGKPTASIDRSLNAVKKSIADVLAAGSGLQIERRRNLQAMSVLVLSLLVVTESIVVAILWVTRP